jgi:hypothetical protein
MEGISMIRRILLTAAAFVLLSASPAHAQYFQVTIQVPSTVVPGEMVTVSVTSFAPGTAVNVGILPSGEVNIGVTNPGSVPGSTTTTAGPTTSTTEATTTTTEPTTTTTEATTTTTEPSTTTTEATTSTTEATTTTTEPSTTTTSSRPPWWPGDGRPPWAGGPNGGWVSGGAWWNNSNGQSGQQDVSWRGGSAPSSTEGSKPESLGTVTTDEHGQATARVRVPAGVEKGKALIAASGVVADGSEQVVKSETLVTDQASESAAGGVSQGVTYVPTASEQPAERDLLANPLAVVGSVGFLVAGSLFLLSRRHRAGFSS